MIFACEWVAGGSGLCNTALHDSDRVALVRVTKDWGPQSGTGQLHARQHSSANGYVDWTVQSHHAAVL